MGHNQIKPKILVILGPTATGKSDLGVLLAKKYNGGIVSADSRQVYKGLDLGSGKITEKEMKNIPHHLLDVVSPIKNTCTNNFSVADYQKLAYQAIDQILAENKLPIIVGGSAFYIQSIVDGLVLPEIKCDQKLRNKLEKLSLEKLQIKLKKIDSRRYSEIDINNKVRLIRSIEIASKIGKVPNIKLQPKYNCLQIGLKISDEVLQENISKRLKKRMRLGLIGEISKLHKKGLSWKRMESFGLEYKYLALFFQNKINKNEMLELIKIKSRQFAKRQMTWFKKDKRIKWINPNDYQKAEKLIKEFNPPCLN